MPEASQEHNMKRYIILLVIFGALEVALALYLTVWREHFWNAVSNKEGADFVHQLYVFTIVAVSICFIYGLQGYMLNMVAIKWREHLNTKAHSLGVRNDKIENLNQRIQEDCMAYPDLALTLASGAAKACAYICVFGASLVLSFSWVYLGVLVAYSIVGTVLTRYIASPLIGLNYEQQRAEATYRNGLTPGNFGACIRIMRGIAVKQKHLTYFQQFYSQVGVVIPLLVVAPLYFTTGMSLGELMRFNSLASTILDNMSYGVVSFAMINKLLSCRKRLVQALII